MRMWQDIARDDNEQPYMRELAKHYLQKLERETARKNASKPARPQNAPPVSGEKRNDI
jgi:hypothetical protein